MPVARTSRTVLATAVMSILVVLAMVAVSLLARDNADLHRRAQVVAEQLHGSAEEMSALKWEVNTEILTGAPDLSTNGVAYTSGARILEQLGAESSQLARLQPGADSERLTNDVQELTAASLQSVSVASSTRERSALASVQGTFTPILNRIDMDTASAAQHQQASAASVLEGSLLASIGSLLLGIAVLAGLGWRLAYVHRRVALEDEVRTIERRTERRIRALLERSSDVVTVLGLDLRVRWSGSVRAAAAGPRARLAHRGADQLDRAP
jgi:hypothetical protein